MLLIIGSPGLRRASLDQLASAIDARATRARSRRTGAPSSSATASSGRSARRAPDATSCGSGTRRSSTPAGGSWPTGSRCWRAWPSRSARAHAEIAPDEAAAAALTLRYVDQRAGPARRDAARRPRASARRDRRQGGLERGDADRPASRRPRLRARGSGPRRVRLARPAADGDPLVQARRARPADRAGRPTAAPAARRRLLGARPGPSRAPRPADRRAAAGVRHHDDPRRPRPGAPGDRHELGGPRRRGRRAPHRRRAHRRLERGAGPVSPRKRPMVRLGDLIPDAARALGLDEELRLSKAMATFESIVAERVPAAAGACRVTRFEGFARRRRGRRPDRRPGAAAPRDRSCWRPSRPRRAGSACANCACTSGAGVPAYNPGHLPATRGERPRSNRDRPPHEASSRPRTGGSADHERPAWPSDSR